MIQVLNRAFDILDYLSAEPDRPKGLGRIAGDLGLHPATCANILKTMVRRGFVDQVEPKGGYTLGLTAYRLTRNGPYHKDLVTAAEPPMTALAKELRETVLIAVLYQHQRMIPCQVEGDQDLQVRSDVTHIPGVYESTTGRLLLAYLPAERLETFIVARGLPGKGVWPGVKTRMQLNAALRKIRKDEKVIDTSQPEIAAAAYPIWQNETVVAALGLFLPKFRFKGEYRRGVLAGLSATAEEITRRMGLMTPQFGLRRRGQTKAGRERNQGADSKHPTQVRLALEFIHSNHQVASIDLESIAAAADSSASHLIGQFKVAVGLAPIAYLLKVRMEAAERLLLTDLRIGEVAHSVGIEDPAYFSRLFRRHNGVSPRQYRRQRAKADLSPPPTRNST